MKIKYFTRQALMDANAVAIHTKRNRSLYQERLAELPELLFPVVWSFVHNDNELRLAIMVGPDPIRLQRVWLDGPFETYNALPEAEVPE